VNGELPLGDGDSNGNDFADTDPGLAETAVSAPAATAPMAAAAAAEVADALPVAAPAPTPAPAPAPAPARTEATRPPEPPQSARPIHIEPYTLPMERLSALASGVGLEWVNSDGDKVAAVQAAMAAEPKPVHVPRAPRPAVVLDEGPLILVETRKDLSQLKLPFEQNAG